MATCQALGCNVEVEPRFAMCMHHWRMLPRRVQKIIKAIEAKRIAAARAEGGE